MNNNQKYSLKRGIKRQFSKLLFTAYRLQASHKVDVDRHELFIGECTYAPWKFDSKFLNFFNCIKLHTLVDVNKIYLIYTYIQQLCKLRVQGAMLEVGVWRGGVGVFSALCFKEFAGEEREVYLADTYEGMPATVSADNFYKGGELADTSVEIVTDLMRSVDLKQVHLLKGYFPDDTAGEIEFMTFSFVHIDVDIYESAAKTFAWAWPKLSINGMVVFDDYGYSATEGVTQLIEEIKNIPNALVIFNMGGQALVIKCS